MNTAARDQTKVNSLLKWKPLKATPIGLLVSH